jgi:hypothetical protein
MKEIALCIASLMAVKLAVSMADQLKHSAIGTKSSFYCPE